MAECGCEKFALALDTSGFERADTGVQKATAGPLPTLESALLQPVFATFDLHCWHCYLMGQTESYVSEGLS